MHAHTCMRTYAHARIHARTLARSHTHTHRGQGLLFFPADAAGEFDERVEHEGAKAIDEKWIARIWKHQYRVPPPCGLPDAYGEYSGVE